MFSKFTVPTIVLTKFAASISFTVWVHKFVIYKKIIWKATVSVWVIIPQLVVIGVEVWGSGWA